MSGIRIGRMTEDYLSYVSHNIRHVFSVVNAYVSLTLNLARTLSKVSTRHKSLLRHSLRFVKFSVLMSPVLA